MVAESSDGRLEEAPSKYIRPADVARELGVPLTRVWRWCRNGDIPTKRVRHEWFIPRSFLDEPESHGGAGQ